MSEKKDTLQLFFKFCTKGYTASSDELKNASEGGASSKAQSSTATRWWKALFIRTDNK